MDSLNDIFNNYGCRLKEDGEEEQDPNAEQQDDGSDGQQNVGSDGQPDVDPDNDPSINPDPTITDQKYQDLDTVHRIQAIEDLTKLLSVINKIKSLKTYGVANNNDITRLAIMLKDLIDKVDIFSTEDIITFKETLIKNTNFNLKKIKSVLNESTSTELITSHERYFVENFEDIFLKRDNIARTTVISSLKHNISEINSLLHHLKYRLENDKTLTFTVFGKFFTNKSALFFTKDCIGLLELAKRELISGGVDLEMNVTLSTFNSRLFSTEIDKDYLICADYASTKSLLECSINEENLFEFLLMFRLSFMLDFSLDNKYRLRKNKLRYYDIIKNYFYYYLIADLFTVSFKEDRIASEIESAIKKYRVDINSIYLLGELEIDEEDKYEISRIMAASHYLNHAKSLSYNNLSINKFDYDLLRASINNFIEERIPELEDTKLIYFSNTANFSDSLLLTVHAFNPLVFISAKITEDIKDI